jgi:hypothetical protein
MTTYREPVIDRKNRLVIEVWELRAEVERLKAELLTKDKQYLREMAKAVTRAAEVGRLKAVIARREDEIDGMLAGEPKPNFDAPRCVINNLGECLARVPEACACRQMPRAVFEAARAALETKP